LAGQGLGSKIIAELLSQLATHFKKMRLGYVESNPQSSHFWSKVGFCPTGEVKELAGKTIHNFVYAKQKTAYFIKKIRQFFICLTVKKWNFFKGEVYEILECFGTC